MRMTRTLSIILLVVSGFSFSLLATGCADDGLPPRSPGDPSSPPFAHSKGSQPDNDTGVSEDSDANNDPSSCPFEPRAAFDDQLQPCCFTDDDCRQSNAPDAHLMRCYGASCTPNGEGLCRIPPTTASSCWTRSDCEPGQLCRDAYMGTCEQPQFGLEFEGICY